MDAALGFRVHTGWAAAVVLTGPASAPRVVDRRRFSLVEKTDHDSLFVYHAAAEVDAAAATSLVATASEVATRSARRDMTQLLSDLGVAGYLLRAVGLPGGAGRALPALGDILRSHSLIHTAEGALFRQALIDACASYGLPVVAVAAKELSQRAARASGLRPDVVKRRVAELGRTLGPPWAADQKEASMAALVAGAAEAARGRRSRSP
jgi:hypothetical protein